MLAVFGEAAQMEQTGCPGGLVQRREGRGPEGAFLAGACLARQFKQTADDGRARWLAALRRAADSMRMSEAGGLT